VPRAAAVKDGLLSAWRRMATAAEAAVNFARRRGAATTAKWQADYDAWQKRDLLLDAVVLSLQNGGGFKIPWRDDRRSASRVVSVLQTTPMILDYETRSTVAGRRLHLRICLIGAPADLRRRHARPGPATRSTSSRVAPHRQRLWELALLKQYAVGADVINSSRRCGTH
jgi:hypothetical protein